MQQILIIKQLNNSITQRTIKYIKTDVLRESEILRQTDKEVGGMQMV